MKQGTLILILALTLPFAACSFKMTPQDSATKLMTEIQTAVENQNTGAVIKRAGAIKSTSLSPVQRTYAYGELLAALDAAGNDAEALQACVALNQNLQQLDDPENSIEGELYSPERIQDVLSKVHAARFDKLTSRGAFFRAKEQGSALQSELAAADQALRDAIAERGQVVAAAQAQNTEPGEKVLAALDRKIEAARSNKEQIASQAQNVTKGDTGLDLFRCASMTYRQHFPDAILVADLLWIDAQALEAEGRPQEAIALYEEIARKDFTGNYRDKVRAKIEGAWKSSSEDAPLPDPPASSPIDIPSPHKEWLEAAQERLAADPQAKDNKAIETRILEIKRAYGQLNDRQHIEALIDLDLTYDGITIDEHQLRLAKALFKLGEVDEAYDTLRAVIDMAVPETQVPAARVMIEHAATHAKSAYEFRKIRKELQGNSALWGDPNFRALVIKLKKQVEGD